MRSSIFEDPQELSGVIERAHDDARRRKNGAANPYMGQDPEYGGFTYCLIFPEGDKSFSAIIDGHLMSQFFEAGVLDENEDWIGTNEDVEAAAREFYGIEDDVPMEILW